MQRDKLKIEAAPFRLSWTALFGGTFAAAGVWLLLHALGLALGFSALEPNDPSDLRASGIGTGIWTAVSSMGAMFAGGVVTARAAGLLGRSNAALHGIVLWGITTIAGLALIVSVVASLARGVSMVSVETVRISGVAPAAQTMSLGFDASDVLAPMNERLTAAGKAQVTPGQLQAALEAAARTATGEDRFDRQLFVDSLARHTNLSRSEVEQALTGSSSAAARTLRDRAGTEQATSTVTARALWAVFLAMLLSLASSVLGAIAGVTRRQRELSAQVAQAAPGASYMPSPPAGAYP